jgi:hypothetical protein
MLELLAKGLIIGNIVSDELPDLENKDVIAYLNYIIIYENHSVLVVS